MRFRVLPLGDTVNKPCRAAKSCGTVIDFVTDRIKINRVKNVLDRIEYPQPRVDAAAEFDDVTLLFADGEANLGELITKADRETFRSADDLSTELNNVMPIEAVGEPGQSDGDA